MNIIVEALKAWVFVLYVGLHLFVMYLMFMAVYLTFWGSVFAWGAWVHRAEGPFWKLWREAWRIL